MLGLQLGQVKIFAGTLSVNIQYPLKFCAATFTPRILAAFPLNKAWMLLAVGLRLDQRGTRVHTPGDAAIHAGIFCSSMKRTRHVQN